MDDSKPLKVGDVAAATGLTVRTLHHYDRLGLVVPRRRADTGHRVYSAADIERIYRIQALRGLGFTLRDVRGLLAGRADRSLGELVAAQLAQVREEIAARRVLAERLERLGDGLHRDRAPDRADLLSVIASTAMLNPELRHDYSAQADRYDSTRGASPSILDPLRELLADAPGRELWDVGGGTGNYAAAMRDDGWRVTVVDLSPQMRRQATAKGLPVIAADATDLPAAAASVDAVMMISMLHQVEDWRTALAEAARILRPGGTLVVMMLTSDHLGEVTWAFDLFPSMRDFAASRRPSVADLTRALPGGRVVPMWFTDLSDASIAALCADPAAVLDERLRRQTSFFERLERDNPAELAEGLATLRRRLSHGESPLDERAEARRRLGDASLLVYRAPE
ncbi:DNA-binding transcriptional MerR regulator [Stackebrandtia albiflava]|uniref:DNA-binding transcriptional MerR regulator n=1 Tax=Stackebrandtia albiflava TaxID=406432 RepID=A0A562VEF1_9ACTN|nr:MerR family transcriptional regulator [Stackebrandtia albiflava]TWJ16201.1 DNA-binding transcriptional MerR regulator [Stackebrandtia albiflava]